MTTTHPARLSPLMPGVYVYFNLHTLVWSIRAETGPDRGRVIAHAERLVLEDCVFKVSEAGRQRVLAQHRRCVHAGVVGTLHRSGGRRSCVAGAMRVNYNPYRGPFFTERESGQFAGVHAARLVIFQDKTLFAIDAQLTPVLSGQPVKPLHDSIHLPNLAR